jgi:EmrB/QacA subfamily drug resistance transporter
MIAEQQHTGERGRTMTLTRETARNGDFPSREDMRVRWWLSGLERRSWTLIAVCGATFMLLVDITIVQVALPTIQRHLGGSFTDLQWVIDAYALTLAAFILTCGSVADRLGRKTVFVTGLGVFTSASVVCGAADSTALLIAARALQGLGGAAIFATGLALIGQEFEGSQRGKAIAAWGATVGGAVAVGPLVGGGLTDTLGWRWIFLVNAPIGIITIAVAASRIVNIGDPGAKRLDWAGLITFSSSLFALMLGLLRGNDQGWRSTMIVSLLIAAVLLMLAFVIVERHHPRPMFDLSLFRTPAFVGVSAATFAIGAGGFAMLPYLTFYLQNDLGYSPLTGGLCLLPCTTLCFLVPLATRRTTDRLPPGVVLSAGLAITAAGLAIMRGLAVGSSWTALIPGLLLTGFGIGFANPAIAKIALGVVAPQRAGMASGISNTCRTAGLATGVAALGAVFQHHLATSLGAQLGHRAPGLANALASGGTHGAQTLAPTQTGVLTASHQAFVSGTNEILGIGSVLVLLGAVGGFALVRARDLHQPAPPRTPNATRRSSQLRPESHRTLPERRRPNESGSSAALTSGPALQARIPPR